MVEGPTLHLAEGRPLSLNGILHSLFHPFGFFRGGGGGEYQLDTAACIFCAIRKIEAFVVFVVLILAGTLNSPPLAQAFGSVEVHSWNPKFAI